MRVPFAEVVCVHVPPEIDDDQAILLTDVFPTGYMAAESCRIQPGDAVAVFGAGPVGQLAITSAQLLGAERVIAIDAVKLDDLPAACKMFSDKRDGCVKVIAQL